MKRRCLIRLLCGLLCLAALLSVFAACDTNAPAQTTDDTTVAQGSSGDPLQTTTVNTGYVTVQTDPPATDPVEPADPYNPSEGAPAVELDWTLLNDRIYSSEEKPPVGTAFFLDPAEAYEQQLWYMPQIIVYARECAKRRPEAAADYEALAAEAEKLRRPEQPDPAPVSPDLSDEFVFSRLIRILNAWSSSKYFDVMGYEYLGGDEWLMIPLRRDGNEYALNESIVPLMIEAYKIKLLTPRIQNLSDGVKNEGYIDRFLTEEELAALHFVSAPTLTETVYEEYGLRSFTLGGLGLFSTAVISTSERGVSTTPLADGEEIFIPAAFLGRLTVTITNKYGFSGSVDVPVRDNSPLLDTPVAFKSERLEKAVRTHIGKPEGSLTKADLTGIATILIECDQIHLNAAMSIPRRSNFSAQEPINNLHDFLWFDSLTQLLVSSNDVASLDGAEPLLKNILMEGLSLPYNRISELPVIQTCLCRSLDLSGNQIADVSPLKDLAVHTLALADNLIEDGEPFAGARFASLDLSGNPMTRFALSVDKLHEMANQGSDIYLDLSSTRLTAIEGLGVGKNADSFRFRSLDISHTEICEETISLVNGIGELTANQCGVKSLDFLKAWSDIGRDQLTALSLEYCGLTLGAVEAELLRRCPNLTSLDLDGNTLLPEFDHPLVTK